MSERSRPDHIVAVVGGAVSGAEATEALVEKGIEVVVFEQNDRPYGKIEDGLPRWHDKQRSQEYARIDAKLDRPEVSFVPRTVLGKHLPFRALVDDWEFSAVLLAIGSWRDRPAGVEGADGLEGKGFHYQNPFIYWFNHHEEKGYDGPRCEVADGAVVLGGGLASIDVAKVLMLETVAERLRARGIACDVVEMEHAGIASTLQGHGLTLSDLGLEGCTLVYRRSVGEMPVASARDRSPEEQERVARVRRKLIDLATSKFLFRVAEHRVATRLVAEDGRVAGVVLARTEYQGKKLVTVEGSEETVRTPLVISSIGSIPMPIPGIEMDGEFYKYDEGEVGKLAGAAGVYALGNVVTGKGNIAVSRRHGRVVADHVIARYLGLAEGPPAGKEDRKASVAEARSMAADARKEQAQAIAADIARKPPVSPGTVDAIRERVAHRWKEIGYDGYRPWIERVTPPDLK